MQNQCLDVSDRDFIRDQTEAAQLAETDAFVELKEPLNIQHDALSGTICGCACLEYCGPHTGPLCRIGPERRALCHYWGGEFAHMRYFRVVACFRLVEPQDVVHEGLGLQRPKHIVFDLTDECAERVFGAEIIGSDLHAGALCAQWSEEFDVGQAHLKSVLQLPLAIAILAVVDCWPDIALDSRLRCVSTSSAHASWKAIRADALAIDPAAPAAVPAAVCPAELTERGHPSEQLQHYVF